MHFIANVDFFSWEGLLKLIGYLLSLLVLHLLLGFEDKP